MLTTVLPRVHYAGDKFSRGADTFNDNVPSLLVGDFQQVFTTHHETDAHFVSYYIPGEDAIPRLNKPILSRVRLQNSDILTQMLVLEWDTPGHQPLTAETFQQFFNQLATSKFPPAMQWVLLYSTRNGVRLVYVLDKPVAVDDAEGRHRGLCNEFVKRGIMVDTTVSDWTRYFRLPYVTRDKIPTWTDPVQEFIYLPDNRLQIDTIPIVMASTKGNTYAEIKPFTDAKPDMDRCRKLLYVDGVNGAAVQTDFLSTAKRKLRGRECFGCLFEHHPLAAPGKRDSTIHAYVGSAINLLYGSCTAEQVYALFLEPVLQLEPDSQTPDWTNVLWDAIGRNWSKEEAKAEHVKAVAQEQAAVAENLTDSIIKGMMEWCKHPDLSDPNKRVDFMKRHLIASVNTTYYLMRPDGYYDQTPVLQPQIISAIRTRGMASIMETRTLNDKGFTVDRNVTQIVGEYATVVSETKAMPAEGGAHIEGMNTPGATLVMPSYWRNTDLEPQYDQDVDNWLQKLGGAQYDKLCTWIAWALAFDEGAICALSIAGKAGSGKKMLTEALGECLRVPATAASEDMVGDHNYGLMRSPYLVIDEGWSKGRNGRHPADEFRHMVSGDPITIKRKYFAPVSVINPVRVIFTANNLEGIRMLTKGRELSPDDREALAIRLLHINITDDASNWLKDMGGHKFTGAPGRRWIRGDGGEASDYIVARHFLWLYSHRNELGVRGGRFLVEGSPVEELSFELRTQSGSSPVVIEALLKMMESKRRFEGLVVQDDRLFALPAEVLEFYRANMGDVVRSSMSAEIILNVFRGVALKIHDACVLASRPNMGMRSWVELDVRTLVQVAEKDGWPCETLRAVLARQVGVAGKVGGNSMPIQVVDNSRAVG